VRHISYYIILVDNRALCWLTFYFYKNYKYL
jgi:hypothetical protein